MHAANVILLWPQEGYIQAVMHVEGKGSLHLLVESVKSERMKTHTRPEVHASVVFHTKRLVEGLCVLKIRTIQHEMQPLLGLERRLYHLIGTEAVALVIFNADQLEKNGFRIQEQY